MHNQLQRNVIVNTAGNLIFFACQYVTTILVVYLGGWADAGLLATAMNIANVCLSVASYGNMRTFQVSDFAHKYSDRTYLDSRRVTLSLAALVCLGFVWANSYTATQRLVAAAYTAYRLLEAWVDVWHGYLQRAERMDLVGVSFAARGLLSLGGFSAGLAFFHNLLVAILLMAGLCFAYILLVDVPFAKRKADFTVPEGGRVWPLLWECLPLAISTFLNTGVGAVPKYFCERMLGDEAMGYFNSVFSPVQILQVGAIYLFVPFITTFAHLWSDRRQKEFTRALLRGAGLLAAVWVVCAVGAHFLGAWAFSLLFGPEILPYMNLVQPLVAATVGTTLALVLCHLLTIMRRRSGMVLGNLLGILASLAATPVLIARFGVPGTAYGTLVAVGTQCITMLIFMLVACRQQFRRDQS